MKILLTGATGFIGSYVLPLLINEGYEVAALVRNTFKLILKDHPRLKIFRGDINNIADIQTAVEGCQTVIHLAALVQSTSKIPDAFNKINFLGTENILKASKNAGVKRFIFSSSLSACTYIPLPVINEESLVRPDRCFSDYAETKALAEQMVKDFSDERMHYIIIYPARVFGIGPLNDANGATKALSLYLDNKLPFMIDRGDQYSSWVSVEDIAKGIVSSVSSNKINQRYIFGGENRTLAEVYNIADRISGRRHFRINIKSTTALRLASIIETTAKLTGRHPLITREWLEFLIQSQKLSSQKAMTDLNYRITPIEIAMNKTIRWLKNPEYSQHHTSEKSNIKKIRFAHSFELSGEIE